MIEFVALHILNEKNVWILVRNLNFRFNDWIHCMQFWFLFYCLRKKKKIEFANEKFQNIVRRKCQHYLINICFNSIIELNFWRLFIWIVNNDIVRHSIITMNNDCTQINHTTIIMNIEKWRTTIHFMIDTIIAFLKKKLFFELNAFKYFIVMLIDNFVDLRLDQN